MKNEAPKYLYVTYSREQLGYAGVRPLGDWVLKSPDLEQHKYVRLDAIDTEKLAEELRAHVVECFMIGAPPGWYELKRILDEALGGGGDNGSVE